MAEEQEQGQGLPVAQYYPEQMYTTGKPSWRYGLRYNPETKAIVHGVDAPHAARTLYFMRGFMEFWISSMSACWPEFIGVKHPGNADPAFNLIMTAPRIRVLREDDTPRQDHGEWRGIRWELDNIPMGNVTDLTLERMENQLHNLYREVAYGEDGIENQEVMDTVRHMVKLQIKNLAN
ncbi:hypothetical protein MAPG_01851 [Magnaporthiopsis poae ATCC 64411]|uniref:Uncharacterized protein n=1 Tax=Magnaporthiopsis poae (strain ATCC 64411 / 73-15) TaxID=644358 RepID=A0A0C4DPS9_MAGP6|nr:hypothetical protein MAPG_01851 [Magnaporthiopsis poae ATCC 64411]